MDNGTGGGASYGEPGEKTWWDLYGNLPPSKYDSTGAIGLPTFAQAIGQGLLNAVQALQNTVIGTANAAISGSPAGQVLNVAGVNTTIPNPDWTYGRSGPEMTGVHQASVAVGQIGWGALFAAAATWLGGVLGGPAGPSDVAGDLGPYAPGDVPNGYTVVRGGVKPPPSGQFSGAAGVDEVDAGAGVPNNQMQTTTAGQIRSNGGTVEVAPEGNPTNYRHVNVTQGGDVNQFGAPKPNPAPLQTRWTAQR